MAILGGNFFAGIIFVVYCGPCGAYWLLMMAFYVLLMLMWLPAEGCGSESVHEVNALMATRLLFITCPAVAIGSASASFPCSPATRRSRREILWSFLEFCCTSHMLFDVNSMKPLEEYCLRGIEGYYDWHVVVETGLGTLRGYSGWTVQMQGWPKTGPF